MSPSLVEGGGRLDHSPMVPPEACVIMDGPLPPLQAHLLLCDPGWAG